MNRMNYRHLVLVAFLLCYIVVMLGAWVRLSDAGLGCPDWPGCYGHLVGVPEAEHEVSQAEAAYPQRPVETHKAWKEVIHRYVAGTLGLLILALFMIAWRRGRQIGVSLLLPGILLPLVIFQALLGMWTVTLLLKPVIVAAHLLGGFSVLALLGLLWLRLAPVQSPGRERFADRDEPRNELEAMQAIRATAHTPAESTRPKPRLLAGVALVLLIGQIFLGAWTSSNYAALACPDFPTCQGELWPETDYAEAFLLWRGLGVNYEFGVLDSVPRATIHVTHRLGALVVTLLVVWLCLRLWRLAGRWRIGAVVLCLALLGQVSIGIATVIHHLPLSLAVAHNGGAALLLLVLVAVNERLWQQSARPVS